MYKMSMNLGYAVHVNVLGKVQLEKKISSWLYGFFGNLALACVLNTLFFKYSKGFLVQYCVTN